MQKVVTVWDSRYCTNAALTNSTVKQADVVRLASAKGLLDICPAVPFDAAETWADIAQVHVPGYATAVRTGRPEGLAESQGFRWSPEFADAVARIWQGQYWAAARVIETGGFVFHPVSGAHHAGRAEGMGFCTLNFLAGAALRVLREGRVRRVAIVDLDAHQGNGTFEWVVGEPRLAHFDISHGYWGVMRTPSWAEYYVASDSAQYAGYLAQLDGWIARQKPDVVFYQAGVDCYELDPVGGIVGVTPEFIAQRDRAVLTCLRDRKIPTVINLGGGYVSTGANHEAGESVAMHVETARIAADVLSSGETVCA
jgi:acetoin utilization deacetylase AcuC-like enzyme